MRVDLALLAAVIEGIASMLPLACRVARRPIEQAAALLVKDEVTRD